MKINAGSPNMKSMVRQKWELEGGWVGSGGKEVGQRSSLKSAGVGRSPPELGHAGELRSGQCGRGNKGVKLVNVAIEKCCRVSAI